MKNRVKKSVKKSGILRSEFDDDLEIGNYKLCYSQDFIVKTIDIVEDIQLVDNFWISLKTFTDQKYNILTEYNTKI